MSGQGTAPCVAADCAWGADVHVHWTFSGESDPMCIRHAAVALLMANDTMALMNGTQAR
jgi:hypothetical protein